MRELRELVQRGHAHDWWYTKFVMRRLSIYLTSLFLRSSITANQVTASNIFLLVTITLLFASGNYWYSVLAALLLQLWLLLDCVDGEIARYRHYKQERTELASMVGNSLEKITHSTFPIVFIGMSFYLYNSLQDIKIFLLGFLLVFFYMFAIIAFPYVNEGVLYMDNINVHKGNRIMQILHGLYRHKTIREVLANSVVVPTLSVFILVGTVLNCLHIVLFFYGIILPPPIIASVYLGLASMRAKANCSNVNA